MSSYRFEPPNPDLRLRMYHHPLAYWYRRPDSFDVTSKQGREGRGLGELASRLLTSLSLGLSMSSGKSEGSSCPSLFIDSTGGSSGVGRLGRESAPVRVPGFARTRSGISSIASYLTFRTHDGAHPRSFSASESDSWIILSSVESDNDFVKTFIKSSQSCASVYLGTGFDEIIDDKQSHILLIYSCHPSLPPQSVNRLYDHLCEMEWLVLHATKGRIRNVVRRHHQEAYGDRGRCSYRG